jgi:DNA-binding response OmpR family regulator
VVSLTEKEYELSRLLFENPERPISRTRLMKDVWGREEDALSRTLDVHISWIRRKLNIGANSDKIRLVVVHGYGYRLMQIPPISENSK